MEHLEGGGLEEEGQKLSHPQPSPCLFLCLLFSGCVSVSVIISFINRPINYKDRVFSQVLLQQFNQREGEGGGTPAVTAGQKLNSKPGFALGI